MAACTGNIPCSVRSNPLRVSRRAAGRAAHLHAPTVRVVAQAASKGPFQGTFGVWSIEPADELEVWTYRVAISVVAASFGAGTVAALAAPDAGWAAPLRQGGNLLAAVGAGGMAVATALIHIYVNPLKRLLQALLAAGAAGGAYLAASHPGVQLPDYVADHPGAVWLVGPAFAALTGITFKEGFCYGKQESFLLALLIPAWLLGHLSGLVPEAGERGLAAAIAALLAVFAARKYVQPVKDDIGDKSVFEFYKLPDEEQQRRMQALRQQQGSADD